MLSGTEKVIIKLESLKLVSSKSKNWNKLFQIIKSTATNCKSNTKKFKHPAINLTLHQNFFQATKMKNEYPHPTKNSLINHFTVSDCFRSRKGYFHLNFRQSDKNKIILNCSWSDIAIFIQRSIFWISCSYYQTINSAISLSS